MYDTLRFNHHSTALVGLVFSGVASACGGGGTDADASVDATGTDAPPSRDCGALASTCGPTGTSPCCGNQLLPSGTFYRSYDVASDALYPDMTSPATVSSFRLDVYEVTVGRFREFVFAGYGTQVNPPPADAGARMLNGMADQGGWDASWNGSLASDTSALMAALHCSPQERQSWTDTPRANEALPINCVTWFDAMAFCTWDGGFLPTEAEWNYAAAGGDEQRAYPWSSPPSSLSIDCSYANHAEAMEYCLNPPTGGVNRVGSESPTGDGRWGHADLAGNVWEWTLDWGATPYLNPCDDCAELTDSGMRVRRGGGFGSGPPYVRGAFRSPTLPNGRLDIVGVRCARMP